MLRKDVPTAMWGTIQSGVAFRWWVWIFTADFPGVKRVSLEIRNQLECSISEEVKKLAVPDLEWFPRDIAITVTIVG
jgi:hypothetical protein